MISDKAIFYLTLLFNLIFKFTFSQNSQNWIYSQQYSHLILAHGQQNLFQKIVVSSYTEIVFISAGKQGILAIDPSQQYNVIANLKSNDHMDGFVCTKDSEYCFTTNNNFLTIYHFSNRTTFQQVGQDIQKVFITDLILNSSEDTLYILQINGQVRILDISEKSNPFLIGQIEWYPQQIYGGLLTQDERFLILCQDFLGLAVFSIKKSDKQVAGILLGTYPGEIYGDCHRAILTPDEKYLISLDYRNGLNFADFTQVLSAKPKDNPHQFDYYLNQWWPSRINVPAPYSFCISKDSNFLFVGVRSTGIYTIDITDKKNPAKYTWVYIPFHGNSITFSPRADYLYYSNSNSFMTFRRMQPLLGQKYVSLYNSNHSLGFSESNTKFYWRCDYDPLRKLYIGAFDTDGLWLIDVSDPTSFDTVLRSYKPPNQDANIDVFFVLNNYKTLVTAMNDGVNFMAVLDVSEYDNIKIIQKVRLGLPVYGYIKDLESNPRNTFLAVAMDREIIFVDITILGSFFVLAIWEFLPQMKGLTTGLTISQDERYLIGACRSYGYFVLDIQDLNNIQLVNYIESTGAEQVYRSKTYDFQFYLVDGLGGLYIMDQTKLPQFVQFSQINVPGWTNDITYLQEEKTVIIATMQQGMIYLLDISDNTNPIIVSSFQYGDYNGFFSCLAENQSKLFINNNNEVRLLPLEVSVQMHTDFIEVLGYSESGEMEFSIINNPDQYIFLVGQTIKLNFCFLYSTLDLIIRKVKLYQQQRQLNLPEWIAYDPVEISAMINITKDAVDPTNIKQSLLNTLVLTTYRPLYLSDFLFEKGKCKIDKEKAQSIITQLQSDGIIDELNYVSRNEQIKEYEIIQLRNYQLFPNKTREEQLYNNCVSDKIKYVLLKSIQNTPVYFNAKSSLSLIIDGSTQDFISTTANLVNIQIEIPKFSGQFIFMNEGSVNIQINSDLNIINIAGRVQNVNSFLSKKIIIYPILPNRYIQILVAVTLTDSINYPINLNRAAFEFPFLVEKQKIQINPNKTLQSQFTDGLYIQTKFDFTIHSSTFIIPDFNTTVIYLVKYLQGDQFIDFDGNDWLQFDNNTSKFYGVPPQSALRQSLTIQVTGSDGYTRASQTFVIHVTQVPFLVVIEWIVSILGPLTAVIGLYNFRGDIYNIIYKKRNQYSQINCQPNKKFILKIPLILNEVDASIQIIKKLQQELIKKEKNEKKNNFKENLSQNLYQKEKLDSSELSKLSKIKNKVSVIIGKLQGYVFTNISSLASNYKKRLKDIQGSPRKSLFEKKYLNINGTINYSAFFENLIEFNINFKFNNDETSIKSISNDLESEYAVLRQCLMFQLARKLIKYDKKSQAVYEYLKQFSQIISPQLTFNDWYKFLVKIQSTEDLDPLGNQIVFPTFSLKLFRLSEAFKFLDIELDFEINQEVILTLRDNNQMGDKEYVFDQIYEKHGINLYLVEQLLFSDAAGVDNNLPNQYFPSRGESIYIESHIINQIVALRYLPGSCICIERILGLDFKSYGPQGNVQLPNWIQLVTQPGLIILKGTPEFSNTETVLIRIQTISNYAIRNFILNVQKDIKKYNQYRKVLSEKHINAKKKNTSGILSTRSQNNTKIKSIFGQRNETNIPKEPNFELDYLPSRIETLQKQNSKSVIRFTERDDIEIFESYNSNPNNNQKSNQLQIEQDLEIHIKRSSQNDQFSNDKKVLLLDQQILSNEKKSQEN